MPEKEPEVKEPKVELKVGEEGYLYGGKYKTVEEMEKGVKEGDKKITELGQSKAASDKALLEATSTIGKLRGGDAEKLEKTKIEERKARVTAFKSAFEKDPDSAFGAIEGLVDEKLTKSGMMKSSDYNARIEQEKAAAAIFTSVKNAHKDDFDALKPEMGKLWAKLPEEARVPEMLETIYLAAKATASPSLKEKIIGDLKSAHTVAPGSASPDDKRTNDDKRMDAIIEAHKSEKKTL